MGCRYTKYIAPLVLSHLTGQEKKVRILVSVKNMSMIKSPCRVVSRIKLYYNTGITDIL